MRARAVSASTLKRLARVESSLHGEDEQGRGGVLLVPPILSLDEWEAVAVPTLNRLASEAAEDIDRKQGARRQPINTR